MNEEEQNAFLRELDKEIKYEEEDDDDEIGILDRVWYNYAWSSIFNTVNMLMIHKPTINLCKKRLLCIKEVYSFYNCNLLFIIFNSKNSQ